MQVKDAFRATMAKAKLYTSGNGNVISTVRMQTVVEQRASRLTPRHLPSFRATVKHVKNAKFYNSIQHTTALVFRACVRVIHKFYE